MGTIYPAAAAIGIAVLGGFGVVLRRMAFGSAAEGSSEEACEEFIPGRYRPMERLLDAGDYEFLERQPGVDRETLRRFRARRRHLFRAYLACLSQDFNTVCTAIKSLMAQAANDRPDLAGLLLRNRLYFTLGMLRAEFHLALQAVGIGSVDTHSLVEALDSMRLELSGLRLAAVSAAA